MVHHLCKIQKSISVFVLFLIVDTTVFIIVEFMHLFQVLLLRFVDLMLFVSSSPAINVFLVLLSVNKCW